MIFRNQPIETDPRGYFLFRCSPLTRTSTRLALEARIDLDHRRVLTARVVRLASWSPAMMASPRSPNDAVPLLSRTRGVGSLAHALASAQALEMAYEAPPPPLVTLCRGLGMAAELMATHTRQLFLTAGPDYSEAALSRTSMPLWRSAQSAKAGGTVFHGYRTIADIMRGMNPMGGKLYRESLHLMRVACEVATLLFGKYPHPSTLFPGGLGIVPDRELFQLLFSRFNLLLDFAKKVTAVWDDLAAFLYRAAPSFEEVGAGPANLLSFGLWDDPESFDASYAQSGQWGSRRLSSPGLIRDRQVVVSHLPDLHGRITSLREEPLETGPLARLWSTTLGGQLRNEFIECSGKPGESEEGLLFDVPKFQLPATFLKWRLPARINALERNRARAYQIAFAGMVGLTCLMRAFESLSRGSRAMSVPYRLPAEGAGVGFGEEGAGAILHEVTLRQRRLSNYQVLTPDDWLATTAESSERPPTALEAALLATPLLEEFSQPETFTGIDLFRVIRSFDA
jgi:hydrogenase large subunit